MSIDLLTPAGAFPARPIWASTPGTEELISLSSECSLQSTDTDTIFQDFAAVAATKKLVIGHNVAYDRARVREQYSIMPSRTKFLDTMSLHMVTSGISTQQKQEWFVYYFRGTMI